MTAGLTDEQILERRAQLRRGLGLPVSDLQDPPKVVESHLQRLDVVRENVELGTEVRVGRHESVDRLRDRERSRQARVGHHSLLALHGRLTRYVAGALLLAACWQLQRKAWSRRAAMPWSRPSGTTGGAR